MEEKAARVKLGEIERKNLRRRLLRERRKFEKQLEQTDERSIEVLKANPVATSSHIADCIDNGEEEVMEKRRGTLQKCIDKCNQALRRIAEGTYGICCECGDPIPIGRLEAVPQTTLCVPCKNEKNSSIR